MISVAMGILNIFLGLFNASTGDFYTSLSGLFLNVPLGLWCMYCGLRPLIAPKFNKPAVYDPRHIMEHGRTYRVLPNQGRRPAYEFPPDSKAKEVIAGEIEGYRAWRLGVDGKLYSIAMPYEWPTDATAWGDVAGGFGVYAYKSKEDLTSYGFHNVYGKIAMWGDVVEHERGWRAQHARIVKLFNAPPETKKLYLERKENAGHCDLQEATGSGPD